MLPIMICQRVQPESEICANVHQSSGQAHRVRFHTAAKGV